MRNVNLDVHPSVGAEQQHGRRPGPVAVGLAGLRRERQTRAGPATGTATGVWNVGGNKTGGGVFSPNSSQSVGGLSVQDGTANTIMINHLRAGPVSGDMRGTWAFPLPGCNYTAAHAVGDAFGPNDTGCCSDDLVGCVDRPDIAMGCWNGGYGQGEARAAHTSGVLAATGDGSTRGFRSGITQAVWFLMNSRCDGQTWAE